MEYEVTKIALYGKEPGAKFTEKELLDAGANIQKYLQSGRLKEINATVTKYEIAKEPEVPELQDTPVPQEKPQAPQAFVYKSQEQGDK